MQDEDKIKRQKRSTERALPQQETEETLPKVSIPIPEEHKSLKKCYLYSSTFPFPRIPFMMSFLVVLALAVWWLVFLWPGNRVLTWNFRTTTLNFCPWLLSPAFLLYDVLRSQELSHRGSCHCSSVYKMCSSLYSTCLGVQRSGNGLPGQLFCTEVKQTFAIHRQIRLKAYGRLVLFSKSSDSLACMFVLITVAMLSPFKIAHKAKWVFYGILPYSSTVIHGTWALWLKKKKSDFIYSEALRIYIMNNEVWSITTPFLGEIKQTSIQSLFCKI